MLTENYQKEKLTIDLVWANISAVLVLIPITLIYGIPYYFLWNVSLSSLDIGKVLGNLDSHLMMVLVYLFGGIIIHELIHGFVAAIFAKKGFKSIRFGVMWKMLTPYCHCKEPLLVKHYILVAIMPIIILGLIPALISIIIGNLGLLIFGIFFTMAGWGDLLMINLIRKENMDALVQDHPSEIGCHIYRKIE